MTVLDCETAWLYFFVEFLRQRLVGVCTLQQFGASCRPFFKVLCFNSELQSSFINQSLPKSRPDAIVVNISITLKIDWSAA